MSDPELSSLNLTLTPQTTESDGSPFASPENLFASAYEPDPEALEPEKPDEEVSLSLEEQQELAARADGEDLNAQAEEEPLVEQDDLLTKKSLADNPWLRIVLCLGLSGIAALFIFGISSLFRSHSSEQTAKRSVSSEEVGSTVDPLQRENDSNKARLTLIGQESKLASEPSAKAQKIPTPPKPKVVARNAPSVGRSPQRSRSQSRIPRRTYTPPPRPIASRPAPPPHSQTRGIFSAHKTQQKPVDPLELWASLAAMGSSETSGVVASTPPSTPSTLNSPLTPTRTEPTASSPEQSPDPDIVTVRIGQGAASTSPLPKLGLYRFPRPVQAATSVSQSSDQSSDKDVTLTVTTSNPYITGKTSQLKTAHQKSPLKSEPTSFNRQPPLFGEDSASEPTLRQVAIGSSVYGVL